MENVCFSQARQIQNTNTVKQKFTIKYTYAKKKDEEFVYVQSKQQQQQQVTR